MVFVGRQSAEWLSTSIGGTESAVACLTVVSSWTAVQSNCRDLHAAGAGAGAGSKSPDVHVLFTVCL
jgi:hypothetical protein